MNKVEKKAKKARTARRLIDIIEKRIFIFFSWSFGGKKKGGGGGGAPCVRDGVTVG